jgi:hypothetical protein
MIASQAIKPAQLKIGLTNGNQACSIFSGSNSGKRNAKGLMKRCFQRIFSWRW